jgi:hypothetical protein
VVLGLKLRASGLLGKHSTTQVRSSTQGYRIVYNFQSSNQSNFFGLGHRDRSEAFLAERKLKEASSTRRDAELGVESNTG